MTERADVVVVGARCAGAALACHLARTGRTVVVVDAAPAGSGQPSSTHLIQPPGIDELDGLGVGDEVRRRAPALTTMRLEFDGHQVDLSYRPGRPAHCLRREALDPLLQEAAARAGADLRAGTRTVGLVRDGDGRVVGIETRQRDGTTARVLAGLVVGADGRASTVARLVGAREYLGYDAPRGSYWAYWPRPAGWPPHLVYNGSFGDDNHVAFPTDGDLLLVATSPPTPRARAWRGEHRTEYLASVATNPTLARALAGSEPVGEVRGVASGRYFFRAAAGPGWALAGDAGHHKDFVAGLGITDALRDARGLAAAVAEGTDHALVAYWRRRDADRVEMARWARTLGAADRVNRLERLAARRAAHDPSLAPRLGAVFDGLLSPFLLVPPGRALRWSLAEAARGRPGVLAPLLANGARTVEARAQLARMTRAAAATGPSRCPPRR
jgi:menaquinone-9 beta-reductase